MRFRFPAYATALALTAMSLAAQQAAQQPAGQQQGPHPKSQKEVDALKKVQADQQAQNWDAEITDINYVLENFADTEYKNMLLDMAIQAAQNKGDYAQTVAFGEQAIQADPNNAEAYVKVAETVAAHIRENDLNKDDELKKVDTNAHKALDVLKTASTPPVGIPADQWPTYKKQLEGQAHDAQGMADDAAKKFPESIDEYKLALAAYPNPIILTHMAKAYIDAKQYDDAIAADDKVLAMNDAPANVKQFAQQQKDSATKMKGAAGTAPPK
jgi:tetratricopeptide (TPR) repeat protein